VYVIPNSTGYDGQMYHYVAHDLLIRIVSEPAGWLVAEVPAIRGCYALMPTLEEALAELRGVFEMIAAEYGEKGLSLPADSTAIVNA